MRKPMIGVATIIFLVSGCSSADGTDDAASARGAYSGDKPCISPDGKDCPPLPSPCPKLEPKDGSDCSSSVTCSYASPICKVPDTAVCELDCTDKSKGHWKVKSECGGPPPPPDPGSCPAVEPTAGTKCDATSTKDCSYVRLCSSGLKVVDYAFCSGGAWFIKSDGSTDCKPIPPPPPPPTSCPLAEPKPGEKCDPSSTGKDCSYTYACSDGTKVTDYFYCASDGAWIMKSTGGCTTPPPPPPTSTCPAIEPKAGDKCLGTSAGDKCEYKTVCGTLDLLYCKGDFWVFGIGPTCGK